jgi:hypothetical protein
MPSAFNAIRRAVADIPPEATEAHRCLDEAGIIQRIEAMLSNPENLIKAFPPQAREAARKVLRDAGVAA